jgi:serine/threonine-protein kinase
MCPACGFETDAPTCPNDGRPTIEQSRLSGQGIVDPQLHRVIADKFVIEERRGGGGFGAVYRARHKATGGFVAIKLMHLDRSDDKAAIRRFYLEAQNTHKLSHPNTVRLSDFGQTEDGLLFQVMEFVDGITLADLLKKEWNLPVVRVVHIIEQVLKSLGEAHSHQLVHRDIKPQNIMLIDQFGEPDFVKVLDFGISRSLDGAGANTQDPLGTPRYMAPEQWRAAQVDGRTDLYSTGCIFYEMLAGAAPFEPNGTGPEVNAAYMLCHLSRPPTATALLHGGIVPLALAELVVQMLAKRRDERPTNAAEVLDRLRVIRAAGELSKDRLPLSRQVVGAQQSPYTPTETIGSDPRGLFGHVDSGPLAEARAASPPPMATEPGPGLPTPNRRAARPWAFAAVLGVLAAGGIGGWLAMRDLTDAKDKPPATTEPQVVPLPLQPGSPTLESAATQPTEATGKPGTEPPPRAPAERPPGAPQPLPPKPAPAADQKFVVTLESDPPGAAVTLGKDGPQLSQATPSTWTVENVLLEPMLAGEKLTLYFKKGARQATATLEASSFKDGKATIEVKLSKAGPARRLDPWGY